MPVSSTRSELLKKRLDQFTRVLNAVEQGDVRALHRARVASRRLRELLPMLQLDADKARKLGRRLKKVTTRLGTVRELDVLLLLVDELHVSRRSRSSALGRVGISVAKDRDDARKRLSTRLPIAGMRRLGAEARSRRRAAAPRRSARRRGRRRAHWRLAVDAQVAARAVAVVGGDGRRRRDVSPGASARRAHRDEEAALRRRTVDRARRRQAAAPA